MEGMSGGQHQKYNKTNTANIIHHIVLTLLRLKAAAVVLAQYYR